MHWVPGCRRKSASRLVYKNFKTMFQFDLHLWRYPILPDPDVDLLQKCKSLLSPNSGKEKFFYANTSFTFWEVWLTSIQNQNNPITYTPRQTLKQIARIHAEDSSWWYLTSNSEWVSESCCHTYYWLLQTLTTNSTITSGLMKVV